MKTWKIIDPGGVVSENGHIKEIEYDCPHCGVEALLPVVGTVIAISADGGVIFDRGPRIMPQHIQCRYCHHHFELPKKSEGAA